MVSNKLHYLPSHQPCLQSSIIRNILTSPKLTLKLKQIKALIIWRSHTVGTKLSEHHREPNAEPTPNIYTSAGS